MKLLSNKEFVATLLLLGASMWFFGEGHPGWGGIYAGVGVWLAT